MPLAYLVMKAKKLPPSLCAIIFFLLMLVCKTAMLWLLQKLQIPETSAVSKAVLSSFLVHFPMFIIGMFFYANFDFFYKLARNRFPIFLIIHICAFYAVAHFGGTASVLATSGGFSKYLLMLTFALCVFSAGYSMQNLSDRILKRRDISYGLYVYHMPIANFIIYTAGTGMSNAMLAFALTVAVSILSYAFVESKFLGMKRRSIRNLS